MLDCSPPPLPLFASIDPPPSSMQDFLMNVCECSFSERAFRQKIARMFMSMSLIMSPISHRKQVVSIVYFFSFLHNMRLMNILVISLRVSKSMSLFFTQDKIIVLKHSYSIISCYKQNGLIKLNNYQIFLVFREKRKAFAS